MICYLSFGKRAVSWVLYVCQEVMARKDVVCSLRAMAADWERAVAAKSRASLVKTLNQLERVVPTPDELLWAGIGKIATASSAQGILKPPEVVRVDTLRQRWKRDYENNPRLLKMSRSIAA